MYAFAARACLQQYCVSTPFFLRKTPCQPTNFTPPPPPDSKRWKEALELLEEMIAGGPTGGRSGPKIIPSVVSYNAAITACARGNKMPKALQVLSQMYPRSGIKPDLYSYGSVLSGLAKARNPQRAIRLLDEMRAAEVEPDLVCLMSAMGACESKGASQEAATVLAMV